MSLYGYPRRTTPNIERFAGISTVYHQHWAGGNFTMPGTGTLLTGVYPWSHRGLHLFNAYITSTYAQRNLFHLCGEPNEWLTYTHNPIVLNLLQQMGIPMLQFRQADKTFIANDLLSYHLFPRDMQTAFWAERIITNLDYGTEPSAPFLGGLQKAYHLLVTERRLAQYKRDFPRGVPSHHDGLYFRLEDAIDWLQTQLTALTSPWRAYFHVLPPHEPYTPRREFIDLFNGDGFAPPEKPLSPFEENFSQSSLNDLRRQYDEYLAYADAEFGRLLDFLEADGRLDDTLVVFTSDHGQMFERGIHAHVTPVLYEGLLHIPLLIHRPGQTTRLDIHTPTSAVDVLPSLAHLLDEPAPPWVEGRLLPPFGDAAARPVFAVEAKESSKWGPLEKATFAMRLGNYKLIHYRGYPKLPEGWELYDLQNDPEELENRFEHDPQGRILQARLLAVLKEKGLAV